MKVTSINYQKVFPLGQYINERIGVEIQVDENDNPDECLIAAKSMVERFHKEKNPYLYQDQTPTTVFTVPENWQPGLHVTAPEKLTPDQETENLISEIENATPDTILSFRLPAARNQRTMGAFNRKKKQLNVQ